MTMTPRPPMTRTNWHAAGIYVTTTNTTDYPPPDYAVAVELALKTELEALVTRHTALLTDVIVLRDQERDLRERVESLEKLVVELARRGGINPEEL